MPLRYHPRSMDRELRATPPYRTLHASARSGLLLTCEHATNRLPRSIRPTPAERELLLSHWGYDIGAWPVTRFVARALLAPAIAGRWSRLLADLNRAVDDPTFAREVALGVRLSWNSGVGPRSRIARAVTVHAGYHAALDRLLAARVARGVRPLLVAIHTFTPEFDGQRRSFDAGVLYDEERGLAVRCATALRESGLSVRYNEPYSGRAGMMYSVDRHASHYGLACLELELNQALFERADAHTRVGRAVARALVRITSRGETPRRRVDRSRPRS